ncbi:uncharacterized protein ALTATR162_LOCUS11390 [Alternaria atra]|uniref:Amine oxidase domain-containing protein n=1 Tax=Alternaria atra TaxID=119953 RepID=A0A8J2IHA9_9PLEO|nr:uncharacterized protein ALTATR162_LOCUS11390 [Alternaria atra]CAG5185734.1 unnamed protein product [Alternaria atra]
MGLKVIIVGGNFSGLSLVNMLEKFDIDYVLPEGYPTIASQLGASVGLLPTGLRILDQLGCYDEMERTVGDANYKAGRTPDSVQEPQYVERILTNKRVFRIEHEPDGVRVFTRDGSTYKGDFVVRADGIHSIVRREMWMVADEEGSGVLKPDPLRYLQCEYKCIFGISKRPAGLAASPLQLNAFFKNCNYLVFSKDIPRYSKEDELALAEQQFEDRITEKVHPLSAQGANTAIETAAVLTNTLLAAARVQETEKPFTEEEEDDIISIFTEVQAHQFKRAVKAVDQGRMMNYMTVKETLRSRVFVNYFFPRFGQSTILNPWVKSPLNGPMINDLPVPAR